MAVEKMLENFLLVGKFVFSNVKFVAENSYFEQHLRTKLKF